MTSALDHVAHVETLLSTLTPVDQREALALEQTTLLLPTLTDPFSEEAQPTHVTASGFVVGPRGVLLHHHLKLGIWVQPGGHIDQGEWPHGAAKREVLEETGLEVADPPAGPTVVRIDVHPGPRGHTHLDLGFLFVGGMEDPAPPPHESQAVRWCTIDEALALAEPGLQGFLGALEARATRLGVEVGPGARKG